MLMKGVAELDPLVATIDAGPCTWCGKCQDVCPTPPSRRRPLPGAKRRRSTPVAARDAAVVFPDCPAGAIDLLGSTNAQILAMIDCMAGETVVRVKEAVS